MNIWIESALIGAVLVGIASAIVYRRASEDKGMAAFFTGLIVLSVLVCLGWLIPAEIVAGRRADEIHARYGYEDVSVGVNGYEVDYRQDGKLCRASMVTDGDDVKDLYSAYCWDIVTVAPR